MKSIQIIGTNNKYQMKKVTRENELYKYRSRMCVNEWDSCLYSEETQLELLRELKREMEEMPNEKKKDCDNFLHKKNHKLMKKEIDAKLCGYKHQDKIKKREGINISFSQTVDKMVETELKCYYCRIKCNIFYERVREMTQWSLDRIDNDLCHSVDNVVISCLKCNLHRKTMSSKRFKDTKDMRDVVLLGGMDNTEISEPFPEAETEPEENPTTRLSKRLIEKLTNNIVVDDSVIVSVQKEIH